MSQLLNSNTSTLKWEPDVPQYIRSLNPYVPGKPIEETEREYGVQGVVKLASNENPLGPSPAALEAIRTQMTLQHLYPDASHHNLKKALSEHLGCSVGCLSIGNGSNESIDLLLRVFAPGQSMVTTQYSFIAYRLCAQLSGTECIEVKVDSNLTCSVDEIISALKPSTKLVFIANPNNPTGAFFKKNQIFRLAQSLEEKKILLVLDYAYWEYVDDSELPDPMEVFRQFSNVVVLRTFSKIYGLAGLRVGYLIADPKIVGLIERARQPFNVNALALSAACAALKDQDYVTRSRIQNQESKDRLIQFFSEKFSNFRVFPSQGNFVLVDMGYSSQKLYPEFLKRGVIIRPVSNYGLPNSFRISLGLPSEMQKLEDATTLVSKEVLSQ